MSTLVSFVTLGKPRPKGSLKCMGANGGRGRHHMEEDNPESKPWKLKMIRDCRAAVGIVPIKRGNRIIGWDGGWEPYAGPVVLAAAFIFERHAGWPSHSTELPFPDDIGDVDKLCRNVLDACEQAGLLANDRLVVSLAAHRRWALPDEKACVRVVVETL